MSEEQHILIAGAGLTGLAIAHGLKKAGIPFTIFEAEEKTAFRPREWTMALHWSIPMLKELLPYDLASRFEAEASVDPSLDYTQRPNNLIPIYDGISGEIVREIEANGVRVSRRKLRTLMAEGIEIQWGHKLSKISHDPTAKVTAHFENANTYTGTLLIGSDGGRSLVRQHIFDPSNATTIPLDIAYTNNTFRYPEPSQAVFARSANPVAAMVAHPLANVLLSMQEVLDPEKPETWMSQVIVMSKKNVLETSTDPSSTNAERHAELKELAKEFPEPFRSAMIDMPETVDIRYQELGYWVPPTSTWDTRNGTVTLAGDAAHPMPPHRGQGLNNALNDAYNLVQALKGMKVEDQADVIQVYSQEVADRGGKEVELSVKTAELLSNFATFRQSAIFTQGLSK